MATRTCNKPTATGPCQRLVSGAGGCGVNHTAAPSTKAAAGANVAPGGPPAAASADGLKPALSSVEMHRRGMSWIERHRHRQLRKDQEALVANLPADHDDAAVTIAARVYNTHDDTQTSTMTRAARSLYVSQDGPEVIRTGRGVAEAAKVMAQRGMRDEFDKLFNPEAKRGNAVVGWNITPDKSGRGDRSAHAAFTEYSAHHAGTPTTISCRLDDGASYDVFVDTGDGKGLCWTNPQRRDNPKPPAWRGDDGRVDADETNTNAVWQDDRNQDREDRYAWSRFDDR